MIIIERIVQNHHIIQASVCFLWVLAEVLLGLDVLLVHHQVLIQVESIHLVHFCLLSEHFRWLIHFVRLSFAQRLSPVGHSTNLAFVHVIIIQRLQRLASYLRWSHHVSFLFNLISLLL